jgi:U3 small nucleolar RNA-associated protein 12
MDEHHMAVWTIAISTTGAFLVSAGADRSLRLYERTREPFFLDEEKEKRLDSMFEDNAGVEMDEEDRRNSERVNLENNNGDNTDALNITVAESGLAGRRTMETLDSADKIAAAVDLAKHELERVAAYENEKRQSADPSKMPPLKPNPLLLNMEPRQYALYQVSQVRPAELERSILCLPFLYCRLLLDYLKYWLERNEKVELCCTMTNLIVRLHFQQLGATREARATLDGLKPLLRSRAKERLDDLGFNIAGMEMIERSAKAKADLTK